jgi:hypothetical protein
VRTTAGCITPAQRAIVESVKPKRRVETDVGAAACFTACTRLGLVAGVPALAAGITGMEKARSSTTPLRVWGGGDHRGGILRDRRGRVNRQPGDAFLLEKEEIYSSCGLAILR